jgi:putative membrane protein
MEADMRFTHASAAAALALAACNGGDDQNRATAQSSAVQNAAASNAAAPVTTPAPPGPQTAANGEQYVGLAGSGDFFEIQSARIAQQKAQRPEVRELAGMILADHQRSAAELARTAAEARPPISASPVLSADQQAKIQALRSANGPAFDQTYLQQQVEAHEQALTLVTAYATGGDVEALRRHASSSAAPIQRHLARARELAGPQPAQ